MHTKITNVLSVSLCYEGLGKECALTSTYTRTMYRVKLSGLVKKNASYKNMVFMKIGHPS